MKSFGNMGFAQKPTKTARFTWLSPKEYTASHRVASLPINYSQRF
jgi:hypothetical protein